MALKDLHPRINYRLRQPAYVYAAGHLRRAVVLLRKMEHVGRYQESSDRLAVLASVVETFADEIERRGAAW